MKTEQKQLRDILIKVAVVVVFASLYAAGGSGDFGGLKWLRRFLAPAIMVGAMCWTAKSLWPLVQLPFCWGALSLPYGADSTIGKVLLRASFGAANGVASSGLNLIRRKWLLAGLQTVLCVATSVVLGVWGGTGNAMVEQFLIGFMIAFLPVMTANKNA
jgi:hypothetical protein